MPTEQETASQSSSLWSTAGSVFDNKLVTQEQGARDKEQMSFMIAFYSTVLMHKVGIIPPTAAAESDDVMYSQMLEPLHIQSINFLPLFPSWAWRYQAKNCNPSSFLPSNVFHSSPFPCHGMD